MLIGYQPSPANSATAYACRHVTTGWLSTLAINNIPRDHTAESNISNRLAHAFHSPGLLAFIAPLPPLSSASLFPYI